MARIRWIYFLFSLGVAALLLHLWLRGEARTASSLVQSARERVEKAELEQEAGASTGAVIRDLLGSAHDAALRELDAAIRMAEREGDEEALAEGLELRGTLHLERNMPQLALDDSIALLERFGDDAETLARAADAALRCIRPELALESASRLRALAPEDPRSALYLGRAHLALSKQALRLCSAMLETQLAPFELLEAMELARRAAALPESVHGHGTSREQVRELFLDEAQAEEAIGYVDLAGTHIASGLSCLVENLKETPDGSAVAGIQDILVDAGYLEASAELGLLALRLNVLKNRPPTLVRTCLALEALERHELAGDIITAHRKRKRPLQLHAIRSERLHRWLSLLDRLQLWDLLYDGARFLAQRHGHNERYRILARYYQGISAFELDRDLSEIQTCFAEATPLLPSNPRMTLRAWTTWAKAAARDEDRRAERYDLGHATRVSPSALEGNPRLQRMLGEAWWRRSEIEAADGEPLLAELSATHALTLLPRKRKELWTWLSQVGKEALVDREMTLEGLRADLREGELPNAERNGPFAAAVTVRFLRENGIFDPMRLYTDLLLAEYPGHPDALEGQLDSYETSRTYSGVVETALQLLERGFSPKRARSALAGVPGEDLVGRDLIRWMSADPSSAAGAVLVDMLDHHRIEEALSLSTRPQLGAINAEVLGLFGRRLGERGHWIEAQQVFAHIARDDPALFAHAGTMVRAGLYASILSRDPDLFTGAFEDLEALALEEHLADPAVGSGELLEAFDTLYAAGRHSKASRILERLEANPGRDTGEVLLRRAVLAAVNSKLDDYRRASERADPFFDDARVLLGELLVSSDQADWTEVARSAFDLIRGELGRDPARRTYLRILAGEFETARGDLEEWQPAPDDPMGLLARLLIEELAPRRRSDGEARLEFPGSESLRSLLIDTDPRFLASCGLGAITPPWCLWSIERLRKLASGRAPNEEPWSAVLRSRALLSLGDPVLAERTLSPWTGTERSLPAALFLAEEGLADQGASGAETLELQLRRLEAGGGAELDGARRELLRSMQLVRQGSPDEALGSLADARRKHPEAHELTIREARLLAELERRSEAIGSYDELFTHQPELSTRLVPEYIELLDATLAAGEIPEEVWWAELEALEAELPEEPAVVLALAGREARELGKGSRSSTGPVRALERLKRFRKRTDELPIDGFRRGIAVPWVELHGRLDPEGALELSHDELRADPLAPHLWVARAKALELAGRPQEALDTLTIALAFTGTLEPQKMRTLLRFEFTTSFAKLRRDILKLEVLFGELQDPELRFHRGLARLAAGKGPRDASYEAETRDAIELWARRDEFGWSAERYAPRLAIALSRSGRGGKALSVLEEVSRTTANPLKAEMFGSMHSLMSVQVAEQRKLLQAELERRREKAGKKGPESPDGSSSEPPESDGNEAPSDASAPSED